MATKTAAKKTAKHSAKPKTAKKHAPAKAAAARAASAKSHPAKAASVKRTVAKVKPATKASSKPIKPTLKIAASTPKSKVELKTTAKAAEAVPAKKPMLVQPLAKLNGKIVQAKKPGEGETPGDPDSPLLDMSDVGVRKMIARAKQRGYVTYDELNKVLPSDKVSSEQIEDTMSMLSEMGINVIESEEQDEQAEGGVPALATGKQVAVAEKEEEQYDRTDDPVRMYLREMGSVELLSREGEIAIAKRIEAGREMMIGGICESPLTVRALVGWRDALVEGKMLLRDIIDLDATYGSTVIDQVDPATVVEIAAGAAADGDEEGDGEEAEAEAEREDVAAEMGDSEDGEGVDCNNCGCPEEAHTEGVGACSHTHCGCKKFVNPGASC